MSKKSRYLKRKQTFSGAQILLFVLIFASVGGFAIWKGLAASGNPKSSGNTVFTLTSGPLGAGGDVEQQSTIAWYNCTQDQTSACVWNNTGCLWTIDDDAGFVGATGNIAPGASTSNGYCVIEDGYGHNINASINSPSPDLVVKVTYQPQNVTFNFKPYLVSRGQYTYSGCVEGPYYSDWRNLPVIANSNNGHGLQGTFTVSVTNPTGRTIKGVNGGFHFGVPFRLSDVCIGGAPSSPFTQGQDYNGIQPYWQTGL